MTDQPPCPRCDRPIHDMGYVCRPCADRVAGDDEHGLRLVVRIAGDITLTVAKLDRIERAGGNDPEPDPWEKNPNALYPTPLPAALSAAAAHDAAVMDLSTWARHCADTRGQAITAAGHPLALLAGYLIEQVEWLRHRQEALEALTAIDRSARTLIGLVDRPPATWYAGRCTCGEVLTPTTGATVIRCVCGAEYDPDDRKAQMLRDLEEVWLTADQCAHAMTLLGLPVIASTIRTWADRHRLAPHPDSLTGRPRYRVGSVRELAEQKRAEERERTLRAAVKAAEIADRKARRAVPAVAT